MAISGDGGLLLANGVRLAWLLDPIDNRAYIYRPGQAMHEIDKPNILSGDPVLPEFRFDFREILRQIENL